MQYEIGLEGATKLMLPVGGGISKNEEVFYNPHMRLARDITVAIASSDRPQSFVDVMAASGARGIRVSKEANISVTANDLNPVAVDLIGENARLNDVEVRIISEDAKALMNRERFDFVDLDPFGPPVEFMDSAVCATKHLGILAVCATDTSALCGTYPRACMRKYDAMPLLSDCYSELGLRILVGFIARNTLRQGRGVEPVFAHSTRHYMRVYMRLTRSHKKTQDAIGYLLHCPICFRRRYVKLANVCQVCECGAKNSIAGPMWTKEFADEKMCDKMCDFFVRRDYLMEARSLTEQIKREQTVTIPHYDIHKLCKMLKISAPKTEGLCTNLKSTGYIAERTHFAHTGIRTDADAQSIADILKNLK